LKQISQWLDQHRALLGLVSIDLRRDGGARDRPASACRRKPCCAVRWLKQYRQLSYEELAFHLEDSRRFAPSHGCRWAGTPKRSVLQKTISAITAASGSDQSDGGGSSRQNQARAGGDVRSTARSSKR